MLGMVILVMVAVINGGVKHAEAVLLTSATDISTPSTVVDLNAWCELSSNGRTEGAPDLPVELLSLPQDKEQIYGRYRHLPDYSLRDSG
jgi:Uma2 family endonuclease